MDETIAWLIDRLIDDAHPAAWTSARVSALLRALATPSGTGEPDRAKLESVVRLQPEAAVAAIRLQNISGRPYAPRRQILPLAALEPSYLSGDKHEELRAAFDRALEDEAEIQARRAPRRSPVENLIALLDQHGLDLSPGDVEYGLPLMMRLTENQHNMLRELLRRWWPQMDLADYADACSAAVLSIGSSIEAPLDPDQWLELLDAHLKAERGMPLIGGDSVLVWLMRTYNADVDRGVIERIATADGRKLQAMTLAAHAGCNDGPVTHAIVARLQELGPADPVWPAIAIRFAEANALELARTLLTDELDSVARSRVIAVLARKGDPDAQLEFLDRLRLRVEAGEQPEGLTFVDLHATAEMLQALAGLARSTLAGNAPDLRNSVLGHLQKWPDQDVLPVLHGLQAEYPDEAWLPDLVDQVTRRVATRAVLERIPTSLALVPAWFQAIADGR
jgi:hypothetical protein